MMILPTTFSPWEDTVPQTSPKSPHTIRKKFRNIHSLKQTASLPLKMGRAPKGKAKVFQTSIFRCNLAVRFREGKLLVKFLGAHLLGGPMWVRSFQTGFCTLRFRHPASPPPWPWWPSPYNFFPTGPTEEPQKRARKGGV